LPDHFRFVTQPEDGLTDGRRLEEDLVRITDSERLLLFGSHYPYWDNMDARTVMAGWDESIRTRVLSENALNWIPRLHARATAASKGRS
jgi:hypothetical protein